MSASPHTLHEWSVQLGAIDGPTRHGTDEWDALAAGSVEPSIAPVVMGMAARFTENRFAAAGRRLGADVEAHGTDVDSVALAVTRYGRQCRRLLWFRHVDGLPVQDVCTLTAELDRPVCHALATLARDTGNEDVAWAAQRELRRWKTALAEHADDCHTEESGTKGRSRS